MGVCQLPWQRKPWLGLLSENTVLLLGLLCFSNVCEEGRRVAAFDITYDDIFMDMNKPEGFAHAVYQIMRLVPGSSLTLAPVCSTWVFMWLGNTVCHIYRLFGLFALTCFAVRSRGSTHRTKTVPLGNQDAPSVQAGNLMVSRCALLCMLASSMGVWWVLEQPRGSLLEYHPDMQKLFKLVRTWRKHIYMKDFGGETAKGTWLYSSALAVLSVWPHRPTIPRGVKSLCVHAYVTLPAFRRSQSPKRSAKPQVDQRSSKSMTSLRSMCLRGLRALSPLWTTMSMLKANTGLRAISP